jgi:hypothetical protein
MIRFIAKFRNRNEYESGKHDIWDRDFAIFEAYAMKSERSQPSCDDDANFYKNYDKFMAPLSRKAWCWIVSDEDHQNIEAKDNV